VKSVNEIEYSLSSGLFKKDTLWTGAENRFTFNRAGSFDTTFHTIGKDEIFEQKMIDVYFYDTIPNATLILTYKNDLLLCKSLIADSGSGYYGLSLRDDTTYKTYRVFDSLTSCTVTQTYFMHNGTWTLWGLDHSCTDVNGNETTTLTQKDDNWVERKSESTIDSDGNTISCRSFKTYNLRPKTYYYIYAYDEYGNWIKKSIYRRKKLMRIIIRNIDYYR
jgi:hypothetical protein